MSTTDGYKKLLEKAKQLMGKAGLFAYDRIKLLCEAFADPDYRLSRGNADDETCAKDLDSYCGDLALKFFALRQLLQHFPDRQQWASGNLERMMQEMKAASNSTATDEDKPKTIRKTAKLSDLQSLEKKLAEALAQVSKLQSDLACSEKECKRLEADNRKLREKLAGANGRIAELNKLASMETVAA